MKIKPLLTTTLVFFLVFFTLRLTFFAILPNHSKIDEPIILIKRGETPKEITKALASQNIISSSTQFLLLGRLTRQWKKVKAGEYQFHATDSPWKIFSILTSGISLNHPFTVREGENMYEIADDLTNKKLSDRKVFLNLCQDSDFIQSLGYFSDPAPKQLEGYLFPSTYFLTRTMSTQDIIRQMVKEFFHYWSFNHEKRAKQIKMDRAKIIILASMIEKETGAPTERAIISSVFYNRLSKKMRLQSDPTTIYGIWEQFRGKIHKSDLLEKNNYNTYKLNALPMGPIGNPGKESIEAALYPTESSFLYFVSKNDGTHHFSRTLKEHNKAVNKYQLNSEIRLGEN